MSEDFVVGLEIRSILCWSWWNIDYHI